MVARCSAIGSLVLENAQTNLCDNSVTLIRHRTLPHAWTSAAYLN